MASGKFTMNVKDSSRKATQSKYQSARGDNRVVKVKSRVPRLNKIHYSDSLKMYMNAFSGAVPKNSPEESLMDSVQRVKSNTTLWSALSRTRSMLSNEIFGTYEPTFKLNTAPYTVTTGVGGVLVFYFSLSFSIMADYTALVALFDEYQFVGPFEIIFRPTLKPANNTSYNMFVGVLDYTDSVALSSTTAALAYDTAQVVVADPYLTSVKPQSECSGTCTWNGMVQGQPDKIWQSTTLSNSVAYWKTYAYTTVLPSSTNLGMVNAHAYLRFRQLGG